MSLTLPARNRLNGRRGAESEKEGYMSAKTTAELGDVQKTLFLPLWSRALESKKENPLLIDKTALEIVEKVDYDFSPIANNMTELSQITWIIRSICVDAIIKNFLERYPNGTIVNIGCGLDTTFDRIDNGTLLWYDLDLPDVISLRKKFIKENERRKFIPVSFLETGWLREIRVAENALFIAAGVFYYFEEAEIKDFLIRLADNFPGSEIFFDVSSPYGIKRANEMIIKNSGLDEGSYLKWELKSTKDILSWDERFKLLKTYDYYRGRHHHLSLQSKIIGFISDLFRIQYMVHLAIMR